MKTHFPIENITNIYKIALEVKILTNTLITMYYKKEVFQPHLPVRLPCYDLAPVISFTLDDSSRLSPSGAPNFHGLTGGVYKVRERIPVSYTHLTLPTT